MQQQVARTFADASSSDPQSELESLEDFSAFLKREGVLEAECSRYLNLLSKRGFVEQVRDAPLVGQPEEAQEELQLVDPFHSSIFLVFSTTFASLRRFLSFAVLICSYVAEVRQHPHSH